VPVSVWDPPAWLEAVEPGAQLVVFGRFRRRFFQGAGALSSRVDLEAIEVARGRDRRRVEALVRRVDAALAFVR
jgi:hypothetical protein